MNQWVFGLLSEVVEAICSAFLIIFANYQVGSPIPLRYIAVFFAIQALVAEARYVLKNGIPKPPEPPKANPGSILTPSSTDPIKVITTLPPKA